MTERRIVPTDRRVSPRRHTDLLEQQARLMDLLREGFVRALTEAYRELADSQTDVARLQARIRVLEEGQ